MNVLELLEDFQRHYSCSDDIEIVNKRIAQLSTALNLGKYNYTLFIEANQDEQRIMLNFFPEVNVQTGKIIDAIMLCNYLNSQYKYSGKLVLLEDIQASFCYKVLLDINNIENPSVSLILMLIVDAGSFLERFNGIICDVAYTPTTFEAIQKGLESKEV